MNRIPPNCPIRLASFLASPVRFSKECSGAGTGNGADIVDDFLSAHTDAVITDSNRSPGGIEFHPDFQFGIVFIQRRISDCFKSQLVASDAFETSSRRKISLLLYQRMNHQLQQLFYFGLKPGVSLL